MDPKTLSVCVFNGGWNLPIWAATKYGIFQNLGLEVQLSYTPNSSAIIDGFYTDKYPVILMSSDNIIAYQRNQAEIPIGGIPDARIFLSGDAGFLSLVTNGSIKKISDLKGKVIGVDKVDTGFAFVLYRILEENGVGLDEVDIQELGGTDRRFMALQENKCDATLLRTPFEKILEERGFNVFSANSSSSTDAYQGTVAAVKQSFLDASTENKKSIQQFYEGYNQGLAWIISHQKEALQLLVEHSPSLSEKVLNDTVKTLIQGFDYYMKPSVLGVKSAYQLREHYYSKFHTERISSQDDEMIMQVIDDMIIDDIYRI